MENKLLGLLRLVSLEERNEIISELALGLEDLYDGVEIVRSSARDFEKSVDRILYGQRLGEDGQIVTSCYNKKEKPIYKRMDD
ncbi:MAG TPA: hypothetical protein VM103_02890 [Candidatus Paceibacterota bacterium]|nr:hypothetical protein [Candidatus Paceibacterota bacterium]